MSPAPLNRCLEELDSNRYILWGHNPNESDFPLRLAITKNLRRGSKIVVIDPKRIKLADKAEMYLKIRSVLDMYQGLCQRMNRPWPMRASIRCRPTWNRKKVPRENAGRNGAKSIP